MTFDFLEKVLKILSIICIIMFVPISLFFCFRVVQQYQRAILLRLGRAIHDGKPMGPGLVFIIPCIDTPYLMDLRTRTFDVPPQEILTKDSVTVSVDAVIYFHVNNPKNCLYSVQEYEKAAYLLAMSTLRNVLGMQSLGEVLKSREAISISIRETLTEILARWGIEIERVEIKDVRLPYNLQKAMAAEAEGVRLAKAKIISAEGEIQAAVNLREASKIMMETPSILQISSNLKLYCIRTGGYDFISLGFKMTEENINVNNLHTYYVIERSVVSGRVVNGRAIVMLQQPPPPPPSPSPEPPPSPPPSPQASPQQTLPHGRTQSNLQSSTLVESSTVEMLLYLLCMTVAIVTLPFSLFFTLRVATEFQRAVKMRNGKLWAQEALGPGLIFLLPCIDDVLLVDLRTICYCVPPQEALTKDSLTVSVDAVVYYKVVKPVYAVINVVNYQSSTQFLASTTLRNALGTKNLAELLQNRPLVGRQIYEQLKELTMDWGIEVEHVEIKDICLPLQLQKAMAAEAETTRLARAKIIVAEAEIQSTKNLQKASEILMENPMCMQLRYLQSLHTISGDKAHTVVFPYSFDTMKKMFSSM